MKRVIFCCGFTQVDLNCQDLTGIDLSDINLSDSDLTFTDFINTNLRVTNLSKCMASAATFEEANLSYAD